MVPLIFKEHFGQNRIVLKMVVSLVHYTEVYTYDGNIMSQRQIYFKRKEIRQPGIIGVSFSWLTEHPQDTTIKLHVTISVMSADL
jgi:hypothetical protein